MACDNEYVALVWPLYLRVRYLCASQMMYPISGSASSKIFVLSSFLAARLSISPEQRKFMLGHCSHPTDSYM